MPSVPSSRSARLLSPATKKDCSREPDHKLSERGGGSDRSSKRTVPKQTLGAFCRNWISSATIGGMLPTHRSKRSEEFGVRQAARSCWLERKEELTLVLPHVGLQQLQEQLVVRLHTQHNE